jgi:hypothetical protein
MAKHTPGPWKCQPIGSSLLNHRRGFEISGPETERSVRDVREDEVRPNARLISAAPDLAEALASTVKFLRFNIGVPHEHAILKAARAALRKAGVLPEEGKD